MQGGWGNELSSMMHFADPFGMPSRKGRRDAEAKKDEFPRRKGRKQR